MQRLILIALATLAASTALAVGALTVLADPKSPTAEAREEKLRLILDLEPRGLPPQPDTESPDWRFLGEDAGILLDGDGPLGLRARLFVRVEGLWLPVAIEEGRGRNIPAR